MGDPLTPTTVDSGIGFPHTIVTPMDTTIDGGLVENQSGKSVDKLDISNDLRFDVSSFANSATIGDLLENIDDEAIDEESPYPKFWSRSTITVPILYMSSPPV